MSSNIHLGTSGWSYREWEGNFYRKGSGESKPTPTHGFSKQRRSTPPSTATRGTVLGWLKYTPADFTFTAKLPKTITHDKALGLKETSAATSKGS